MMKKFVLVIVALTFSVTSFSQKYMDDIAEKACGCLHSVSDTLATDDFNMKLGLCMIEAATPYQKQLKKDYGIDFNKIDEQGAELGRIIGMRMVSVCPEALVKMASRVKGEESEGVEELEVTDVNENTYVGTITQVDNSQFVVFTVKNSEGKLSKFYWFGFISSNTELTADYTNFKGKSVMITFVQKEYFDPRIGEYRMMNIIESMNISGE